MHILLLNAHPDEGNLSDAIATAYIEGSQEAGHEIRCVVLRELQFDLVLRSGYHSAKPLEPDVVEQQELIRWCEHLVVVTRTAGGAPQPCSKDTSTASSFPGSPCGIMPGFRMSNRS